MAIIRSTSELMILKLRSFDIGNHNSIYMIEIVSKLSSTNWLYKLTCWMVAISIIQTCTHITAVNTSFVFQNQSERWAFRDVLPFEMCYKKRYSYVTQSNHFHVPFVELVVVLCLKIFDFHLHKFRELFFVLKKRGQRGARVLGWHASLICRHDNEMASQIQQIVVTLILVCTMHGMISLYGNCSVNNHIYYDSL